MTAAEMLEAIAGTLPDGEPFFEAETDELTAALAELEQECQRLVDTSVLVGR